MTVFHGKAAHHKRSGNSRNRSKSAHNFGRKPEYKDARRNVGDDGQVCSKCDEYKPLTDFYKRSGSDGKFHFMCKPCMLAEAKQRKRDGLTQYGAFLQKLRNERIAPYDPVPIEKLLNRRRIWFSGTWTKQDEGDLKALCLAGADINRVADALGRTPYAAAYRARIMALELPPQWTAVVAPKRLLKPRVPRFILKYPYLAKARPSDEELLRVNDLVPHGYPDWMRADICQAVLLAYYEGDVSIAELEANKANLRWFYKKYYREQAPREEVQATASPDDDRSYDEQAVSRKYYQTLERHEDAGQIEYVYEREVKAARFLMAGKLTNLRDAEWMLHEGEIKIANLRLELFRPWDRIRKHARLRLKERFGIELSQEQAEKLVDFCRQRQADDRDNHCELHILRGRSGELPIVYDRKVNEIISFLPKGSTGLGGWFPEVAPRTAAAQMTGDCPAALPSQLVSSSGNRREGRASLNNAHFLR